MSTYGTSFCIHFDTFNLILYSSAYHSFCQLKLENQFEDIKPQFACIYADLFANFNHQIDKDVESKICVEHNYKPLHIVPSTDLIEKFNMTKQKVADLCSIAELKHLCQIVESVHFSRESW